MNGGARIASVLSAVGVRDLFTLCGGHISPILVEAKRAGIRVTDVRHEATAVFAADAVARLTGVPGVAALTAGPGLTNAVTAVKNAQLAQSPVVVLGGATATALRGRGALQDIDQLALLRPHVKWARAVRRSRDVDIALAEGLHAAREGVPGPVFLEYPLDVLYEEATVREWYAGSIPRGSGVVDRAIRWHLERHVDRLFADVGGVAAVEPDVPVPHPPARTIARTAGALERAERPVVVCGSQVLTRPADARAVAEALDRMGIPVFLSGMARGLLGRRHDLHIRHRRREALRRADLAILAGVPCDFRLDYGRAMGPDCKVISANRSRRDRRLNRRPKIESAGDAGAFLVAVADAMSGTGPDHGAWVEELRRRDADREAEIEARSRKVPSEGVDPLALCRAIDAALPDEAVIVADGGDFVATASYIVRPPGPLCWLDPGPFGTLGVGGGFALGAARARPGAAVWILYGDGSAGYSIAEFDTFVRHGIPVVAVVGNDACWAQIARDQIKRFADDVGVRLARTDYERVAEGLGAVGLRIDRAADVEPVLRQALSHQREGLPVLINARLAETDFREGSISV